MRIRKKKQKGDRLTVILVLVFLAGLSLLLYPSFSNYWNSFHQTRAIAAYNEEVTGMSDEELEALWEEAVSYNEALVKKSGAVKLLERDKEKYNSILNVGGNGVMGYIDIPSIDVSLPIYHGTADSVLQVAAGHLDWTSLPVGGESTHCVLSGHRGLPSAKLFTDLNKLVEGDIFQLQILNKVLTYEVDQILIVEPQEISPLQIEKGKDYCTLVTCTPYGINTHRLLVRGHRIDNPDENTIMVTADAIQIEPVIVAPVVAVPMLLILFIWMVITDRKRK